MKAKIPQEQQPTKEAEKSSKKKLEEQLPQIRSFRNQQIKADLADHLPDDVIGLIFGYITEVLQIELNHANQYINLKPLTEVYVSDQHLESTTLTCTLHLAYIFNINLSKSILQSFFLNGVEFLQSNFTETEFKTTYQAVIPDVKPVPNKFIDCLFDRTKFSISGIATQFIKCTIKQTIFGEKSKLKIEKFEDCTVEETDFGKFDLSGTFFINTKLFGNKFQKAILNNTILAGFSENLLNLLAKSKNEYSLLLLLLQDYVGSNFLTNAYNQSKKIYWKQVNSTLATLANPEAKQEQPSQQAYTDLLNAIETNSTLETGIDTLADRLGFIAAITANLKLLTRLLPYMQNKNENLVKFPATAPTPDNETTLTITS